VFNKFPENINEFYTELLAASINSLKLNTYLDNFDKERFNLDGKDHSLEFNAQERSFYFNWFFSSHADLFDAYRVLDDEYSRLLYLYLICYRLAGHHSVKIPLDWIQRKAEYSEYIKIRESRGIAI